MYWRHLRILFSISMNLNSNLSPLKQWLLIAISTVTLRENKHLLAGLTRTCGWWARLIQLVKNTIHAVTTRSDSISKGCPIYLLMTILWQKELKFNFHRWYRPSVFWSRYVFSYKRNSENNSKIRSIFLSPFLSEGTTCLNHILIITDSSYYLFF